MTLQRVETDTVPRWSAPGAAAVLTKKDIFFDMCERLVVASIFGAFAWRMLSNFSVTADVSTLLVVLAEALPFFFIIIRPPSATLSQRPSDWFFGILGTIAPLLVSPVDSVSLVPEALSFIVMLTGISIQVAAKVILGRSFGIIAANRGVKILGPYRFVRHPMYAGYTITHVGFLLARPSLLNAAIYGTVLALQIARISREERVLKQDPSYREFAGRVRYRLLPGVF